MDLQTDELCGFAQVEPRRSPTCEVLMELVARAEDGEDIGDVLAAETGRIELFMTADCDHEFESVCAVEDAMQASLVLYVEGCALLSALDTEAAREKFLQADRLMQRAASIVADTLEDVGSNVPEEQAA